MGGILKKNYAFILLKVYLIGINLINKFLMKGLKPMYNEYMKLIIERVCLMSFNLTKYLATINIIKRFLPV